MNSGNHMTANAGEKVKLLSRQLDALKQEGKIERIVFAESCTAGLVSALVGQVPGISEFLCGSAVTYRESVRQQWLGVPSETLKNSSAESAKTAEAMAVGVLNKTEEATCSAAISGDLDGVTFVCVAAKNESDQAMAITIGTYRLQSRSRSERQYESAANVIEMITDLLAGVFYSPDNDPRK